MSSGRVTPEWSAPDSRWATQALPEEPVCATLARRAIKPTHPATQSVLAPEITASCYDVESKKRGRKPGSTKAAIEAAKRARGELLSQVFAQDAVPPLPEQNSPPLHSGGRIDASALVLGDGSVGVGMEDILNHVGRLGQTISGMGRVLPGLQKSIPLSQYGTVEDIFRSALLFSCETHCNKDLGLVLKFGLSNINPKLQLRDLRISLSFENGDTKELERPVNFFLLDQDGHPSKDLSHSEVLVDPFTLVPNDMRVIALALGFASFTRRDAHLVAKFPASTGNTVVKEERFPIYLVNQCLVLHNNHRLLPPSCLFVGAHSLKIDTLRRLFSLMPTEGISPGDIFWIERAHPDALVDKDPLMCCAEVKRIEDSGQRVDLELHQGHADGALQLMQELRMQY